MHTPRAVDVTWRALCRPFRPSEEKLKAFSELGNWTN